VSVPYSRMYCFLIYSMQIDPNKWLRQLEQDETKEHIANLLAEFDKKVIVFGCDRVDYTKGPPWAS